MIGVTGRRSAIIDALASITRELVVHASVCGVQRFVLAAGLLHGKPAREQDEGDIAKTLWANIGDHIAICEGILESNPAARICVLGSESAYRGSYDMTYAASKAGLHGYVETRRVGQRQQLVAVAPHIIADAGMTLRRPDYAETMQRGLTAPRGRWITAREVAATIHWLLWSDEGLWLNNVVLRLSGGARSGS